MNKKIIGSGTRRQKKRHEKCLESESFFFLRPCVLLDVIFQLSSSPKHVGRKALETKTDELSLRLNNLLGGDYRGAIAGDLSRKYNGI